MDIAKDLGGLKKEILSALSAETLLILSEEFQKEKDEVIKECIQQKKNKNEIKRTVTILSKSKNQTKKKDNKIQFNFEEKIKKLEADVALLEKIEEDRDRRMSLEEKHDGKLVKDLKDMKDKFSKVKEGLKEMIRCQKRDLCQTFVDYSSGEEEVESNINVKDEQKEENSMK